MAKKTWIKATQPFTRRLGRQMVVGHPKHPEANGRVAEVDDGAQVAALVSQGFAKRISRQEYLREMEGGPVVDAGEVRKDQLAGKAPRASVTMSDGQLDQLASERKVDISKAKNRAEVVQLINKAQGDIGPDDSNLAKDRFSRTSQDTTSTTNHPQRTGINADVTDQGTADRLGFSRSGFQTADEGAVQDDDDAAPRSSSSSRSSSSRSSSRSSGSRAKSSTKSGSKTTKAASGDATKTGDTGEGSGGAEGSGSTGS